MIVNAPGILAVFVAVVEFVAGGALLFAAVRGLRIPDDAAPAREPLRHLLLLLVLLLGVLACVSLLLWALLLQSYVPQWDGVLCVEGVLRVGEGSAGAAGWLPGLARATTALRTAFLLGAGSALVLHLAGREEREGVLRRGHLALLAATALLAVGGAAAETLYVVLPKTGRFLATGCCSTTAAFAAGTASAPLGSAARSMLAAVYAASSLGLAATLATGRPYGRRRVAADLVRVAGAALVLAAGLVFAREVVAPAALGLPLHRCNYCLAADAPESLFGFALLATPFLAAVWRAALGWLGPAGGHTVDRLEQVLDHIGLAGALGALVLFSTMWGLA